MSKRKTLKELDRPTSSPASAAGPSPSSSPDGPTTSPHGPAPVPASPSASRAKLEAWATSGTYGPLFIGSSPSAGLQSSLANRLKARMAAGGSLEYELTWKDWDMPSGPPICALRASGRRTVAKGCSGWPTPDTESGGHTSRGGNRKDEPLMGGIVRGLTTESSSAETGSTAGFLLNPRFSLWLQGYPVEWASCGERAAASSRKPRRSS